MSWTLAWPATSGEVLLWAQTLLVWHCAAYVASGDPVGKQAILDDKSSATPAGRARARRRAATVGLAIFLLPGLTRAHWPARLLLAAWAASLLAALPRGRARLAGCRPGLLAEWELGVGAAFALGSGVLVGQAHLMVIQPLLSLPCSSAKLAAACLSLAATAFVLQGGTHVVRGVLDKAGTLPMQRPNGDSEPGATQVDVPEYNRGRTIGQLERLIMTTAAALGNYEVLGLIIAAKGLIRAKEFEDRDFAEYFIMGSLASTAVALAVGATLRAALLDLWAR